MLKFSKDRFIKRILNEEENDAALALVDQVITAYYGNALENLESYRISTESIGPSFGQGHTPCLDETNHIESVLLVDITKKRASLDNWNKTRGGIGQGLTVLSDEQIINLNLNDMKSQPAGAQNLY